MKHFRWIETLMLILLIVMVVLCFARMLWDDNVKLQQSDAHMTQIALEDCPVSEESIDGFIGLRRTYTFSLPSELAVGDDLVLHIMHQYCTVHVGGQTRYLYEDGAPHFIRTSGRYWACVPLSDADAGKTVDVILTPVYTYSPMPDMFICPIDHAVSDTLYHDFPLILVGQLCMAMGISLYVIAMFTVFNRRTRRALVCLAVLTVATGVWKIAGLPVTTLLLRSAQSVFLQPKAIYLYGMIGFLLIPVLIIQYLNGMQHSKNAIPETICALIMAMTDVVVLTLQFIGKLEIQSAVPFLTTESTMLVLMLLALIVYRREAVWLICFPICMCADLLITRLAGNSRYAVLLMACILVSDYISGVIFVRRMIRQKSELREARATALIQQIQPHFIHNTLTSIYYLCDSDPQTAKQLVRDFNNHLRANFTSLSVKTPIAFTEELEHVHAYLSVEQVRFSDKLFVEYDTPHTDFRLPALTLQPLVENAVKHNVDSSRPPVHIRIGSYKTDDGSKVVIEDDGGGVQNGKDDAREHVGLKNVADRLQMLCGGALTVARRLDGGSVVTVFIPDKPEV